MTQVFASAATGLQAFKAADDKRRIALDLYNVIVDRISSSGVGHPCSERTDNGCERMGVKLLSVI